VFSSIRLSRLSPVSIITNTAIDAGAPLITKRPVKANGTVTTHPKYVF
jgi:hypothetical protein